MTALPDTSVYDRNEGDELLVLGCDGIWDVMSNEECSSEILRLVRDEVCTCYCAVLLCIVHVGGLLYAF